MNDRAAHDQSEAWDRNRNALRRRFPALADILESRGPSLPETVQVSNARNGAPTISVTIPNGRAHVHSSYDPIIEARRWASAQAMQGAGFLVVIGMGLGYHIQSLLETSSLRHLVVIEPHHDLFIASMTARDQTKLLSNPRFDLQVTPNPKAAAAWLAAKYRRQLLTQPSIAVWPATSRYAGSFVTSFQKEVLDHLRFTRTNVATHSKFSTQWVDNFFANAESSVEDPGIRSFLPVFQGRPGLIVSAGPSLEKNVHLLSSAKGRAVILAAGSAINPLRKHGIEPDLLVSYDPSEANFRHFEDLHTPDLPLVYVPTIFPRIVETYAGPRFTSAMDTFPFISWLFQELGEAKGLLSSGPSVANVCWHLAFQMGLNPIILVGQDLAYTGLKSHAEGATHARSVAIHPNEIGQRYLEVESVDGRTVYTDRAMNSMRLWFEHQISHAPQGHVTIDATEGGARIRGTQIMPLKEAIESYCREAFDPHATLLSIHRQESERLRSGDLRRRWGDLLTQLHGYLREIEELASIGVKDGQQVLRESKTKRLTEQRFGEAVNRFNRLSASLSRLVGYQVLVQPLIAHILDSITLAMNQRWEEQADLFGKGRELARHYFVLFGGVRRMSKHITHLVHEARRRSAPASTAVIDDQA